VDLKPGKNDIDSVALLDYRCQRFVFESMIGGSRLTPDLSEASCEKDLDEVEGHICQGQPHATRLVIASATALKPDSFLATSRRTVLH
jgi:hypothetical protein